MRADTAILVSDLGKAISSGPWVNQYGVSAMGTGRCETYDATVVTCNRVRRRNLASYLDAMTALKPQLLLVGEAAGVRGCCLSGIPFTSEDVMARGCLPDAKVGVCNPGRERDKLPVKEATATIVWSAILALEPLPLLWNAFPFHPHRPNLPCTNRRPTVPELEQGGYYLLRLLDLFPGMTVAAVGNSAEFSLKRLGIACVKLRHPSYGGKQAFVAGLNALYGV